MSNRTTSAKFTVKTYRDDKLYPRIVKAVDTLLKKGKVVAPVDVLVEMGLLQPKVLEDWRLGRVPYLEKVIDGNLTRLSRLLRILRFHAQDLNLAPSLTVYMRWGKGLKQRLRFTKTGDPKLEEAYSRHFVWTGKKTVASKKAATKKTTVAKTPAKKTARKESATKKTIAQKIQG